MNKSPIATGKVIAGNVTTGTKSEETRTRILEAALALFRKRSFATTTMRDIAKEAEVALGAAYYYFESKDALVTAFYERAHRELTPLAEQALARAKDLEGRLRAVLTVKFKYFAPNRSLMAALSAHIDPQNPLSPFSPDMKTIRDQDIALFARTLEGSKVRVSEDLKQHLPRLLWLYQMGLLLFWVYDRSPRQKRTTQLFDKSLSIVANLIKLSSFPLLRPVRKVATDLLETIYGDEPALGLKS
jgi:AcrR family transcriptional regulator